MKRIQSFWASAGAGLIMSSMRVRFSLAVSVMVSLVCTAEALCLLPGVPLSATEAECCRHMAGNCDRVPMPESHSCCNATARNSDGAVFAKAVSMPGSLAAVADYPAGNTDFTQDGPAPVQLLIINHPPPGNKSAPTILRI